MFVHFQNVNLWQSYVNRVIRVSPTNFGNTFYYLKNSGNAYKYDVINYDWL
jgi:hypothetical protein